MEFVFTLRNYGNYQIGTGDSNERNGYKGVCDAEITIPEKHDEIYVTTIGQMAFSNSPTLVSVTFHEHIIRINSRAFDQCSIQSIIIPESCEYLGNYCFSANNISSVCIPVNVKYIGCCPFGANQNLSEISVDTNNFWFSTDNYGSLLNREQSVFIQALHDKKEVIVPHTVHTIKTQAFDHCYNLETIVITSNIKTFEEYTFHTLKGLKKIVYYGYNAIPGKAFFAIPEFNFIVCKDYRGESTDTLQVLKTGYCYRKCITKQSIFNRHINYLTFLMIYISFKS